MRTLHRSFPLVRLLAGSVLLVLLAFAAVVPPRPTAPTRQAVRADTTPPWRWPEHPENLKVLPENISPEQLRNVMFGFTQALGVRCLHCHVGEEGKPFNQWDFPADDKEAKQTARLMLRMVHTINETYLDSLDHHHDAGMTAAGHDDHLQVTCLTCHHGQPRPLLLEDLLAGVLEKEGRDAALARYAALRKQFYGGFTYNFQPSSLENLAMRLLHEDRPDDALAFLQLNLDQNDETGRTQRLLSDAYVAQGDTATAVTHLRRAIELEPRNPGHQQRLKELTEP